MKKFPRDPALLDALRALVPNTPDPDHAGLKRNLRRVGADSINEYRDMLMAQIHWSDNMAAIIRNHAPDGQIPISFLRNEDTIAVLHGIGLGLDPAVAVELAYKDLLMFGDLNWEGHGGADPEEYRLLAVVTEPGDDEPSLGMFAHKDAATHAMEWGAEECALLHNYAAEGRMVPMSRDFWPHYLSAVGMKYDHLAEVFYRFDEPLPASPSEWSAARKAVMEALPLDLDERTDPHIRAARFNADGATALFDYNGTIAVAGLIHMGIAPNLAASIVGDAKALAVKIGQIEEETAGHIMSGNFEPVNHLVIDGESWIVFMDDLGFYAPDERFNAWAIKRDGTPVDIVPGKTDPTRHLDAKTEYRFFAKAQGRARMARGLV